MTTRVLLFGTTGQVGWELHRALQAMGPVTAISRTDADFANPESLRAFFAGTTPATVVVNAVAYTAVDQAESDVAGAMQVNAAAVAVLADESRRCGALLVHYSTDYVFDGEATTPYHEDAPTNPQSSYGRSKLAGEAAIVASGCRHLILRTSWVYASRGKNFLRTMLRLAGERETLRVVGDQRGTPTSARLIADCTVRIVARALAEPDHSPSGIYNLTASGETTWHGFASYIVARARATGWAPLAVESIDAITTADYPVPAKRPAYSRLDISRLRTTFDIEPPDWTVGVDLCLAELRTSS